MIKRYSTDRMNKIWSIENKFSTYLMVEIASLKSFSKIGIIPPQVPIKVEKKSRIDLKRILEIEKETKHDVVAFIKQVSETLGEKEKKWFHYGLTSTDIVDTAYGLQIKFANKYLLNEINNLSKLLKLNAFKYKKTPIIGRTHGVHAEITFFGLKWALWYDEMQRNLKRFKIASEQIEVGKISGAVGNHVNVSPKIQDLTMKFLNLKSVNISTQTLQRDRHANYIFSLAIIASTLEKIATEIRHLQRTEIREVEENFQKNQKGSSAMPHKKNPIISENISGLSRIIRSYVTPALEDNILWHERDISHSSVERIIIPDATTLLDYMLTKYTKTLSNIKVNEENMMKNIEKTNGLIFSQKVLNTLIVRGMDRQEAYNIIQKISLKSWDNNESFFKLLSNNKDIKNKLNEKELLDCFNINSYSKEVDSIYKRVFKS